MLGLFAMRIAAPLLPSAVDLLASALPEESRGELSRFRLVADRDRKLLAESLVRYVLRTQVGRQESLAVFARNEYGKPYLKEAPEVHFNVSHSGEWAVCILHDQPAGIDVEQIRPIHVHSVARRYFADQEQARLFSLPESQQLQGFYELWTCKESYMKAEGLGMSLPLRDFSVVIEGRTAHAYPAYPGALASKPRSFKLYSLDGAMMAACAEENARFPDQPVRLTSDELMNSSLT